MKNLSMKQISLLGLLLVSASAIIAAVLPAKENKNSLVGNGSLRLSSCDDANVFTCVPTANPAVGNTCNASATTSATTAGCGTSAEHGFEDSTSTDSFWNDDNGSVNNTNAND